MAGDEGKESRQEERQFSETHIKLTKFIREKPTIKKLEDFMKESPDLIIYVSKEKIREAHRQIQETQRPRPTRSILQKKTPEKSSADKKEQK